MGGWRPVRPWLLHPRACAAAARLRARCPRSPRPPCGSFAEPDLTSAHAGQGGPSFMAVHWGASAGQGCCGRASGAAMLSCCPAGAAPGVLGFGSRPFPWSRPPAFYQSPRPPPPPPPPAARSSSACSTRAACRPPPTPTRPPSWRPAAPAPRRSCAAPRVRCALAALVLKCLLRCPCSCPLPAACCLQLDLEHGRCPASPTAPALRPVPRRGGAPDLQPPLPAHPGGAARHRVRGGWQLTVGRWVGGWASLPAGGLPAAATTASASTRCPLISLPPRPLPPALPPSLPAASSCTRRSSRPATACWACRRSAWWPRRCGGLALVGRRRGGPAAW